MKNEIEFDIDFKVLNKITASDHNLIKLNLKVKNNEDFMEINETNLKRIKWWSLKEDLLRKYYDYKIDINSKEELEEEIKKIQKDMYKIMLNNTRKRKERERKNAVWWSTELRIKRSKVNALRRKFQNEQREEQKNNLKINYRKELAQYKKLINISKRNYFKEFITKNLNELKYYEVYKKFIYKEKKDLQALENAEGNIIYERVEIIKEILDYHFKKDEIKESIEEEEEMNSINFKTTEIQYILDKSKKGKAPGIDGIYTEIIKELWLINKGLISEILNKCIEYKYFPCIWKQAKVLLLPKIGKDAIKAENYRPICLLPCWGKLLDKLITTRLDYYLETINWYADTQFGFRKNKSTLEAMNEVTEFAKKAFENKEMVLMLVLDIKSAFNNASWNSIIKIIKKIEIPNYLKKIIQSFIENRLATCENITIKYTRGVPQGSSLGPKLWLLIINEILKRDQGLQIQAFADDICILINAKNVHNINQKIVPVIRSLEEWAEKHELEFSIQKCEFTVLTRGINIKTFPTIKLKGEKIKYKKEIKYLGVIFDHKLTFISHLDKLKEKLLKNIVRLNMVSRQTWGISKYIMKNIYISIIERQLLYGVETWFTDKIKFVNKLKSLQRSVLLPFSHCYTTVSTDAINVLMGIIPIEIKAKMLKKMYKLKLGKEEIILVNERITREDVDWAFCEQSPPWENFEIRWSKTYEQRGERIYTDGSKMEGKVGCAFIHVGKNNEIIKEQLIRLSDKTTVFAAEIQAIYEATKYSMEKGYSEVTINSDSMSSLQAIKKISNNRFIEEIRNLLKNNFESITLNWVRAHAGDVNNERADEAAKKATRLNEVTVTKKWTIRQLKNLMKKEMVIQWQNKWEQSDNGRVTFGYYPKVNIARNKGNFYVNQILTGHGAIPEFQHRRFGKDGTCWCKKEEGNVHHLIYKCELVKDIREKYFPKNFLNVELKHLLSVDKSYTGLYFIMKYFFDLSLCR